MSDEYNNFRNHGGQSRDFSSAFDGDALDERIRHMPRGAQRAEAIMGAIRQADEAQDHFWRLMFRYSYACEVTFHVDPPMAIPVAAQFAEIFEAHPHALDAANDPQAVAEMYLMVVQIGIDPIVTMPQIPMETWKRLMEKFYALVKQYHLGLRTYWWQMTQFYQYVDKKLALQYFEKFWKTGRDGLSDCIACERSNAVKMYLLAGERSKADEQAKILESKTTFCSDTPHKMWLVYLEDALARKDYDEAAVWADKVNRKVTPDRGHLYFYGPLVQCWGHTDPDRALKVIQDRLVWTVGMWDQLSVYRFYKGCWATFRGLEKARQDSLALSLPRQFPFFRPDGVYDAGALADWFHDQAAAIAAAFDKRNGNGWFAHDLTLA